MSKRSRNSGRRKIKLHLTTFRFVLIQKTLGKAPQARWKVHSLGTLRSPPSLRGLQPPPCPCCDSPQPSIHDHTSGPRWSHRTPIPTVNEVTQGTACNLSWWHLSSQQWAGLYLGFHSWKACCYLQPEPARVTLAFAAPLVEPWAKTGRGSPRGTQRSQGGKACWARMQFSSSYPEPPS